MKSRRRCVCRSTGADSSDVDELFTFTGATDDPSLAAEEQWYDDFLADPDKNCTAILADFRQCVVSDALFGCSCCLTRLPTVSTANACASNWQRRVWLSVAAALSAGA